MKRGGGGGGPVGYSRGTGANPMASFNSSQGSFAAEDPPDALDSFTAPEPPELHGPAAEAGGGLSAEDAADTGWKTQYGVFDLTACGGDVSQQAVLRVLVLSRSSPTDCV